MSKATKSKSRLGRGLSSLISVSELPVTMDVAESADVLESTKATALEPIAAPGPMGDSQHEIPVDSISHNPHQPRKQINEASIAELSASIKSTGLVQPIVVRRTDSGYQLIAGERRLRAVKLAGMQSIPAIVRDVDSSTQAQMALVENIQREDLNPLDRAQSYRALIEQLGLTQSELAGRLGEDRSSIANFLRLLDLCEPVRDMVRDGRLTLGHAKILAGITDILEQERLSNLVLNQGLSVRNLERLLSGTSLDSPSIRREQSASAHLLDLEKTISRQLGMRVQIRSNAKGKGRLTIHYGSLDQFDELLQRLGVRTE